MYEHDVFHPDWKLQAWIEKAPRKIEPAGRDSKLINAYLKSGRSRAYLDQALGTMEPLSDYERDLLQVQKCGWRGMSDSSNLRKLCSNPSAS